MFQSSVSVYYSGVDDDVTRIPLRHGAGDVPQLVLVQPKKTIVLRDYQQEATDCCLRDLQKVRSSLIVLATGLGKTILFCKLVEQWAGRVLVLAHLEELLQNARDDLRSITGEAVGTERGDEHHEGERIVVGLIQSVRGRLNHFKRDHFRLIIIDEAHHATSKDYRRVLEYFSDAKVVGLTATDSRADGEPLPFDRVSYRMGIREGQDESFLVPVRGKRVVIDKLDLTRVKRCGGNGDGDFDDKALDDAMVQGSVAIADVLTNDYPFDKGILFFPGCASARLTCEMLNEREPDCAVYIDGKIKGEERRQLVNMLKDGKRRWLCNVGIATEGFNWPEASIVGMCCPTLSRPAYVQRVGRGTRPLAGLLNGLSSSSMRKAAIAGSKKPSMLILDFVGVSANLDLITSETFLDEKPVNDVSDDDLDFFGTPEKGDGEIPDDSEDETFGKPININLRGLAKSIKSKTTHSYDDFDPFEPSGQNHPSLQLTNSTFGREESISYKQYRLLCKFGVDDETLTKTEAQKLVSYVAGQGFRLWAPQISVLKKIHRDILEGRSEVFG